MKTTSIQNSKFTAVGRHFYQFLFLLLSKDLEDHLVKQGLVMYALGQCFICDCGIRLYTYKKNQSCEVASYHQYTLKHALFSINPFEFVYQIAAQWHECDSGWNILKEIKKKFPRYRCCCSLQVRFPLLGW